MKGYAIGILSDVRIGPAIAEYLDRIDATLAPNRGRFIIHGGVADVREGSRPGDVIVIEFPSRRHAVRWYESPGYREIVPLRAENAAGTILLLEGVNDDHRATDVLAQAA